MRWKRWRKCLKAKQDPEQVRYKKACLGEIAELEKQGRIDLFYGDESGFYLTPVMAYSWQYPGEEIRVLPQKSKRINVFGIMSQDNRLVSFQKEGSIKSDFVVESLQQWAGTLTKPTVLVLDNASVHQAKRLLEKLAQWQEESSLFVFFLPKYCPHLNKIETLWRKVKYEWRQPKDYTSLPILKEALSKVFSQVGQQYSIHFNDPIL